MTRHAGPGESRQRLGPSFFGMAFGLENDNARSFTEGEALAITIEWATRFRAHRTKGLETGKSHTTEGIGTSCHYNIGGSGFDPDLTRGNGQCAV